MTSICRYSTIVTALAVVAAQPCLAQAQTVADRQFSIALPAQSLASALGELSVQTGATVLAPGDIVAGKTAPAVSGKLTIGEALALLLAC